MNIIYLSMTGGTCKKRNQGIKQSNGDVLLFMDDDAILQRDYIKHLISAFINENIHVMTGYIFDSIDLISPPLKRKGEIDYLLKNVDDDFVKLVTEKVFMYASLSYTNKDFIMRQLRYFIKCIFLLESHAKGKILRSGYRSEMPDLNHINGLVEVEWFYGIFAARKDVLIEFNFNEDLENYPYALNEDLELAARIGKKYDIYLNSEMKLLHLRSKEQRLNAQKRLCSFIISTYVISNIRGSKLAHSWSVCGLLLSSLVKYLFNKGSVYEFYGIIDGLKSITSSRCKK